RTPRPCGGEVGFIAIDLQWGGVDLPVVGDGETVCGVERQRLARAGRLCGSSRGYEQDDEPEDGPALCHGWPHSVSALVSSSVRSMCSAVDVHSRGSIATSAAISARVRCTP